MYDPNNVFAKIIRGEIPSKKILEGTHFLAFHDIHPRAPIHVLIIPKGPYMNFYDFTNNATFMEIADFYRGAQKTIDALDIREKGYRLLSNNGKNGGQEVFHFHVHILSGRIDLEGVG